jgi:DDE superfamily endonuclease
MRIFLWSTVKAILCQLVMDMPIEGPSASGVWASSGPWFRSTFVSTSLDTEEQLTMAALKRYAQTPVNAKQRQRLHAKARHERQQRQAQRDINALHHALHDVGLPDTLVVEIEGRLRAQKKLLGKLFGLMFPTLFGCRSAYELTRVRGWDKNAPSRILGALPKRSWLKRLRKLGHDILSPLWSHVESMSAATRSRWQWTWVWDDSVFRKYGQAFELVGKWYSGQHKRVVRGIDGVLLIVVIGDGKLIVPVDFAVRRPDPKGSGARCRNKLAWAQVMVDQSLMALARRGLHLPTPIAVADSWFSDSKLMRHVRERHQGLLLVHGKSTYAFRLPDGRKVKGADLLEGETWPWRQSLDAPDCRYARLRARSATYGEVTLLLVDKPGEDRFYLLCLATAMPATRLLRVWSRRHLIEQVFRTLKHLLATDACQVRSEDAYYGHLVLRLMASFVLYYTSRIICKGRVTMDEMIFNLRHHWSSVNCQELELYGLS